jgi:hypothetical protein
MSDHLTGKEAIDSKHKWMLESLADGSFFYRLSGRAQNLRDDTLIELIVSGLKQADREHEAEWHREQERIKRRLEQGPARY